MYLQYQLIKTLQDERLRAVTAVTRDYPQTAR
jgi:hypothetical protein